VSESTETLAHTITDQLCTIIQAEVASILLHSPVTAELIAFGTSDTLISVRLGYALHHDTLTDELAAAEQVRITGLARKAQAL